MKKPAQLRPDDTGIRQPGEKRFDGIQDNPLCSDGINGTPQADEQSFQVVLTRLLNLAALDVDVVRGDETTRTPCHEDQNPGR